jgi:tetratricopeptide (TPR) repeat protein
MREVGAANLSRLAARFIIEPVEPDLRYRFHDLTREYARRRAEDHYAGTDEQRAVRERVYRALLTLTRRAHRGIYNGDFDVVHGEVPDWDAPAAVLAELAEAPLGWYEAERSNIRAAVEHTAELGLTELCWDLAVSAHEFYTIRGYLDDWYATHQIALTACREAGNLRGEAAVMAILGQPALAASRRSGVSGAEDLQRAADLFARSGDRHGQAIALRTLANNLRRRGQLEGALATFTESLDLYVASGDTVGQWQALRYIGQTHLEMGDYDEALRVLGSAEELAHRSAQPRLAAQTRFWIGQARLALGDPARARADFEYVLGAIGGDAEDTGRAYVTFGLGQAARLAGDDEAAERYLTTAAELASDAADAVLEGRAHWSAADLYGARGQVAKQISGLARAVACFGRSDAAYLHAGALAALGDAYATGGAPDGARSAWTRAWEHYAALGLPEADEMQRKLSEPPVS